MKENLIISLSSGEVHFSPESGGMPEKIIIHEFDRDTVISGKPELTLNIRNHGTVRPVKSKNEPLRFQINGAEALEFTDLIWQDENGVVIPELHLGLRYEFFPDGSVFCSAIFHAETAIIKR